MVYLKIANMLVIVSVKKSKAKKEAKDTIYCFLTSVTNFNI